jgi:hypothetical protein
LVAFRGDTDHIVNRSIASRLGSIHNTFITSDNAVRYRELVRWFFGEQVQELGLTRAIGEIEADGVRRAAIVHAMGELGRDQRVLSEAEALVREEMAEPARFDANVAGTLVALGALNGGATVLKRYMDEYLRRKNERMSPDLQARYVGALSAFEDKDANARVLAMCLDETVPQEQLRVVIAPMLGRRATQKAAWEFLKKNWKVIGPRIGSMGIARLVEATGALPPELAGDVEKFFTANPVEEAKRALQKALEAMKLKAELVKRETGTLNTWLARRAA